MPSLGSQNKSQQEWYSLYSSKIQNLLQYDSDLKVDNKNLEKIMEFLACLFPYFGQKIGKAYEVYDKNIVRKNNQIAHPEKFDRYFNLDLDGITIKKYEIFNAAFILDVKDFVKFLLEQEKKGTSYEFLEELRALISDLSPDRVKTISIALLTASPCLDTYSQKNFLLLPSSTLASI